MQKSVVILAAIALTSAVTSASPLFVPDPSTASNSPSTPPTTFTAGTPYTQTVSNGASITYSNSTITPSDINVSGDQAYIRSTESVANTDTITTSITFTPTYSNVDSAGSAGGQSNLNFFSLIPSSGANNNVLGVTLQTLGYGVNRASIILTTGIAYGGGTQVGNAEYDSTGVNSLSGLTFTLNVTQVFVTSQTGNSTIITTGVLSDAQNADLYNYNYVNTNNASGTGYDPSNDTGGGGLVFETGLLGTDYGSGFVNPGASLVISGVSVTAVPEPATCASLLVGGCALLLAPRRRANA